MKVFNVIMVMLIPQFKKRHIKTIEIIESRIDLISKTIDLYDPQYCSKDNKYFSLKSSHIIGEFFHMKNHLSLRMGLHRTVHLLMSVSLS